MISSLRQRAKNSSKICSRFNDERTNERTIIIRKTIQKIERCNERIHFMSYYRFLKFDSQNLTCFTSAELSIFSVAVVCLVCLVSRRSI